jgi:hypothetical protein
VNLIFAGTPLAEVVSKPSSESAIGYVIEDQSPNDGLILFVTSEEPLIQTRKRRRSIENYVDIDNDINVKRRGE